MNELEKFSLQEADILLTKDSESPDDIGIPSFVSEPLDGTVCGYHLAMIRNQTSELYPEFVYRFIESKSSRDYFFISANGVTRFGLGKSVIENMWVPVPPLVEQLQISTRLRSLSLNMAVISDRLTSMIGLLKEYRQSLISSVVTGKIRITEDTV
jgi:type I restriction enzyme S subunit